MNVCSGFGITVYSSIFFLLELFSIIVLFYYYLRQIINLLNNQNNSYDKIDLILIYLSEIQLLLFFLMLCKDYNIFSLLVTINKFSQNLMICSLIMIIILGKYSQSKNAIINYFLITLLIGDILLFLIGINEREVFKKSEKESLSALITAILCVVINLAIIYKSYSFKVDVNRKINDNIDNNKLVSLNSNNSINSTNSNNTDVDFFNSILNHHLKNALTLLSVYFYILIPFCISYITEIILYFFDLNYSGIDIIIPKDDSNNNTTLYNETELNSSYYLSETPSKNNTCIFTQNNNNEFNFNKLLICFAFFVLKDFLPYFITYLMFFHYKLKYHRKISF